MILIHVHMCNKLGCPWAHINCYNTIEPLLHFDEFKSMLTGVEGDKMRCVGDLYVYTPLEIMLEGDVVAAMDML